MSNAGVVLRKKLIEDARRRKCEAAEAGSASVDRKEPQQIAFGELAVGDRFAYPNMDLIMEKVSETSYRLVNIRGDALMGRVRRKASHEMVYVLPKDARGSAFIYTQPGKHHPPEWMKDESVNIDGPTRFGDFRLMVFGPKEDIDKAYEALNSVYKNGFGAIMSLSLAKPASGDRAQISLVVHATDQKDARQSIREVLDGAGVDVEGSTIKEAASARPGFVEVYLQGLDPEEAKRVKRAALYVPEIMTFGPSSGGEFLAKVVAGSEKEAIAFVRKAFDKAGVEFGEVMDESRDLSNIDPKHRFYKEGNVIIDAFTHLQWQVGPDRDTPWDEAFSWADSLGDGWRLPTRQELSELFSAGIHRDAWGPFENSGQFAWSDELQNPISAWLFAFVRGKFSGVGWGYRNAAHPGTRAFAVRDPQRKSETPQTESVGQGGRVDEIIRLAIQKSKIHQVKEWLRTGKNWQKEVADLLDRTAEKAKEKGLSEEQVNMEVATYLVYLATTTMSREKSKKESASDKTENRTPEEWTRFYQEAPASVQKDMLTDFANRKRLWNAKKISLSREKVQELRNFQIGVAAAGVTEKEFNAARTLEESDSQDREGDPGLLPGEDYAIEEGDQWEPLDVVEEDGGIRWGLGWVNDVPVYWRVFDADQRGPDPEEGFTVAKEGESVGGYVREGLGWIRESNEPEEDSITTEDDTHWYQYGKLYHTGDAESLKAKMDRDGFWPSVYSVSDHGNAVPVTFKESKVVVDDVDDEEEFPEVEKMRRQKPKKSQIDKEKPPRKTEAATQPRLVWRITKDYLYDQGHDEDEKSGVGQSNSRDPGKIDAIKKSKGKVKPFRLYDDDGELYYAGEMAMTDGSDPYEAENILSPLDNYGMPNAGCTEMKIRTDKGWVGV